MAHILYSSRALRPSIPRKIQWSCYGEAVARLQGLCVAATAVCAGGAGHLIFVIMMNKCSLIIDFHS